MYILTNRLLNNNDNLTIKTQGNLYKYQNINNLCQYNNFRGFSNPDLPLPVEPCKNYL